MLVLPRSAAWTYIDSADLFDGDFLTKGTSIERYNTYRELLVDHTLQQSRHTSKYFTCIRIFLNFIAYFWIWNSRIPEHNATIRSRAGRDVHPIRRGCESTAIRLRLRCGDCVYRPAREWAIGGARRVSVARESPDSVRRPVVPKQPRCVV